MVCLSAATLGVLVAVHGVILPSSTLFIPSVTSLRPCPAHRFCYPFTDVLSHLRTPPPSSFLSLPLPLRPLILSLQLCAFNDLSSSLPCTPRDFIITQVSSFLPSSSFLLLSCSSSLPVTPGHHLLVTPPLDATFRQEQQPVFCSFSMLFLSWEGNNRVTSHTERTSTLPRPRPLLPSFRYFLIFIHHSLLLYWKSLVLRRLHIK